MHKTPVKKTFVLAAIMWLTIFLIPFLKYPASPPTVGDADTVVLRQILYLLFIAISGFSAVGFFVLYKKLQNKKKGFAFVGYAVFITAVFFMMPPSPDEVTAPIKPPAIAIAAAKAKIGFPKPSSQIGRASCRERV